MKAARKNTLLLIAIIVGTVSLPMTWFHVSDVSAELPSGMGELFGDMLRGMSFEITGLQGSIAWLGGLPFWGAIGIVVLASTAQILSRLPAFDIPVAAHWGLASIGFATVALPLVSSFSGDASISPRLGWFVALIAASIPLVLLALPSPDATMAANHPMQPSGEVGRFEVDDQPSPPADR